LNRSGIVRGWVRDSRSWFVSFRPTDVIFLLAQVDVVDGLVLLLVEFISRQKSGTKHSDDGRSEIARGINECTEYSYSYIMLRGFPLSYVAEGALKAEWPPD
jgi:hypothetical protein